MILDALPEQLLSMKVFTPHIFQENVCYLNAINKDGCFSCLLGLFQLFNVQKKAMSFSEFKKLANCDR